MIKHLITGGCSFSTGQNTHSWTGNLTKYLMEINPNLTTEHTGYYSQGQELIQKKVTLATIDALNLGIKPEEILVVVMWSGTHRKAWYIDNKDIIKQMVNGWPKFVGGMSSQFLDLKNKGAEFPEFFQTFNGSKFDYNPNGGWYFTVDGSDCKLNFVRDYYLLDHYPPGIGKIHTSIENIVVLQNFCKLNNIKMVQQFFMDAPLRDIKDNKDHQIINYLYNQLDFNSIIDNGMFEYLHGFLSVSREKAIRIPHNERLELQKMYGNQSYFSDDGFHPGDFGYELWCKNILFPFIINGNFIL